MKKPTVKNFLHKNGLFCGNERLLHARARQTAGDAPLDMLQKVPRHFCFGMSFLDEAH